MDHPAPSRRQLERESPDTRLKAVGQYLRTTRQERGEDLYDIAEFLRIRPSYLFALEEGDLDAMPGRPYAFGFLRSYADYLGFDGNQVVVEVKAMLAGGAPPRSVKIERPRPANTGRPAYPLIAAAIILIIAALGGWRVLQQEPSPLVARLASLPGDVGAYLSDLLPDGNSSSGAARSHVAELQPGDPLPVAPASATDELPTATIGAPSTSLPVATPIEAADKGRQAAPLSLESAMADAGAANAPVAAQPPLDGSTSQAAWVPERLVMGEPASAGRLGQLPDTVLAFLAERRPADAGAGAAQASELPRDLGIELASRLAGRSADDLLSGLQLAGARNADNGVPIDLARVVLVARETSWIQVKSDDRVFVRSRTLAPGERFALPDRADLALWTGNAGGLEVVVDGQNLGTLGRRGAVMRDVTLAPEALVAMLR